jgi:hypothetical protein
LRGEIATEACPFVVGLPGFSGNGRAANMDAPVWPQDLLSMFDFGSAKGKL